MRGLCPDGEIGRRKGLKIPRLRAPRIKNNPFLAKGFIVFGVRYTRHFFVRTAGGQAVRQA